MDVRLGYSVGLDSVPDKVADMLNELNLHKPGHLVELAMHMIELGHHEMASTLIDEARQSLAKADRALTESQMILDGYIDAKKSPKVGEPSVAASAQEPSVNSAGETDVD